MKGSFAGVSAWAEEGVKHWGVVTAMSVTTKIHRSRLCKERGGAEDDAASHAAGDAVGDAVGDDGGDDTVMMSLDAMSLDAMSLDAMTWG